MLSVHGGVRLAATARRFLFFADANLVESVKARSGADDARAMTEAAAAALALVPDVVIATGTFKYMPRRTPTDSPAISTD